MNEGAPIEDLDDEALKRAIKAETDEVNRREARLGALILEARHRDISQTEIAKLMGISQSAVSQREKLLREAPPTE
jgi:DNA-directed RNA polymerase specialized sigma subunit